LRGGNAAECGEHGCGQPSQSSSAPWSYGVPFERHRLDGFLVSEFLLDYAAFGNYLPILLQQRYGR